jgi:uncharacterized membrane protein (DUF106 family)
MVDWLVGAFEFVFAPLLSVFKSPVVSLFIVSTILTLIVLALNKVSINRKVVKELKAKMEEIKESLTLAQRNGNKSEIDRFMGEMMKINSQYMKHSFKALIISIVVLALFLPWLRFRFSGSAAVLPFSLPVVGSSIDWIYWYILASLAVGWVIRKLVEGE